MAVESVAFDGVALRSVLGSPGALLRGWRTEMGWTQDDVALTVRVSRAAVTSWETDVRRIPAQALEDLDFAWVANGCLADLVRATVSAQGPAGGALVAGPRRRWGHVFPGEPGPVWAWVRPTVGDRVAGHFRTGLLGMRFDEVTGPAGVFLTEPYAGPCLPLRVTLNEPGWVDFGRGTLPPWLDRPVRTSAGFAGAKVNIAGRLVIGCYVQGFRDRGAPETLRDRLRTLAGPYRSAGMDPRPPQTAHERTTLHRRLREARAMSQADAAAAANTLLAGAGSAGEAWVTRQQIRNYEEGRASRVRYLPALLDMAYGVFGWSCWEPVWVTRTGAGEFEAAFPRWWVGPVGVTAVPSAAFPLRGSLTLASGHWRSDCPLPGTGFRAAVTAEHLQMPDEAPLRIRVPPGWRLQAHMGHRASAVDADAMRRPWLSA